MDNVPKAHKKEKVEGQLWVTLRLLAATEGNIHLFNSLKNKNLATNDVSNFIKKQTIHRKVDKIRHWIHRKIDELPDNGFTERSKKQTFIREPLGG